MGNDQQAEQIHTSVLLPECMHYLDVQAGKVYVDGTLGLGGHTEAILTASAPDGRVIAFEWDDSALQHALTRLEDYKDRLTIVRRNFAELAAWAGRNRCPGDRWFADRYRGFFSST